MTDLKGRLQDQPLPTLLHQLFASKATGTMHVNARMGRHDVFLREGYPVQVNLPGTAELLGKVLLEMGIIDDAIHKRSMAEPPPKGKRYGDHLLDMGAVTVDQIRLALKAQVRRKLHRLFFLNDGDFSFDPGEHKQGLQGQESLRVHPYRAIYHGVRSAWSAERLADALFLLDGRALKLKSTTEDVARYGVGPEDGRVAQLMQKGFWSLPDLADAAGLPPQPIHALVYAFYITDALELRGVNEVPRLKRRANEPPVVQPGREEGSGAWRVPSGEFKFPQPVSQKSIPVPGTPTRSSTEIAAISGMPLVAPAVAPDIDGMRKLIEAKAHIVENENLFDVLGVSQTATRDEIKTAYFEAARKFHPDRLASLSLEGLRPEVEKIFRRVSEAYSTLSDEKQRQEYMATLGKPNTETSEHQKAMKVLEAEMAFRRGEILLRKNDFSGAVAEFESAHNANPQEGEHVAYLAWARLCAGQINHATARPLLQEALKMSPKCARAHYFHGVCLKEEGDIDKACNAFKKAVDLDARLIEAERELRIINMRRENEKKGKGSFFSKLLNKK